MSVDMSSCDVCDKEFEYEMLTSLCEICLKSVCSCAHDECIQVCANCLFKPLSDINGKKYTFTLFPKNSRECEQLRIEIRASFTTGELTIVLYYNYKLHNKYDYDRLYRYTLPEFIHFWEQFISDTEFLNFPDGARYRIYKEGDKKTGFKLDENMYPIIADFISKL
jgi:hypothetical protein